MADTGAKDCGTSIKEGCASFWFTYTTPKLVSVRDRKLGLFFNFLQFSVIVYLAIYVCGYKCKHLVKEKATGLTRLTIQQPTKGCNPLDRTCDSNFSAATKLPYCTQYRGDLVVPDQQECMFHDGIDISYEIPVPGTLYAISRYSKFKQKKDCDPESSDDGGCHGALYRSAKDAHESTFYMADIEHFTLLFGHGFQASDDNGKIVKGQGAELDGYLKPGGPASPKAYSITSKESGLRSVHRIKNLGDVMSIGDLLRLTSSDMSVTLDTLGADDKPLRYNGCVIVVHVQYTNSQPFDIFATSKPYYIMTAQRLKISEFKKMYRDDRGWAPVEERLVVDSHGVLVVVELTGDILFFQWLHLFQVLTTAIGFFAIARVVSDMVMAKCMTHAEKYNLLKYQVTKQFEQEAPDTGLLSSGVFSTGGSMDSDTSTRGGDKESKHSKILKTCADDKKAPANMDLLHILLNFEWRLNHLDGHHPEVVGKDEEPIVKLLKDAEARHQRGSEYQGR
jgi:hypothetical protein